MYALIMHASWEDVSSVRWSVRWRDVHNIPLVITYSYILLQIQNLTITYNLIFII